MRCRHENADHLMAGERWALMDDPVSEFGQRVTQCEQLRCVDCGAWLSLGPANDAPDEVRVEQRAAEIAQEIADVTAKRAKNKTFEGRDVCYRHLSMDGAEHAGHLTMMSGSAKVPEQPGEWSGYLAAYIAHGDES